MPKICNYNRRKKEIIISDTFLSKKIPLENVTFRESNKHTNLTVRNYRLGITG